MKRLAGFIGGAFLLVAAVLAWGRFAPMPEERAAAMRLLMTPPPPVAGRDGSDALWLVTRDVPIAEQAKVAAEYRRFLDAQQASRASGRKAQAFRSRNPNPLERYRKFNSKLDWRCRADELRCLDHVRDSPDLFASLLAKHPRQLAAAHAIAEFDGLRYGLQWAHDAPVQPPYSQGRGLVSTALAVRFALGEQEDAIAATCRDLAGWRRLAKDNDLLIGVALATDWAGMDAWLLGEMLAERRATGPLPADCGAALAPMTAADFDLCPAMHGELLEERDYEVRVERKTHGLFERLRVATRDPDRATSLVAPHFARYCSAGLHAHMVADQPAVAFPRARSSCGRLERLAYPADCSDNFFSARRQRYLDSLLDNRADLAARLALVRTWLWLREQSADPREWPALVPRRPASLGLRREVRFERNKLAIVPYDRVLGTTFDVPLPPVPRSGTGP